MLDIPTSIGDILRKKNQEVIAVGHESTISEAAGVMARNKIGLLVVLNGSRKFIGVMSERDIVKAVATSPDSISEMEVGDLVTRRVVACDPHATPDEVINIMNEKGFRHMPVVENGSVKGIVSRADLVGHLAD